MGTEIGQPSANMTCGFFRLSGELRNLIYKYALTEPDGLIYQKIDGMGRLRTLTPDTQHQVEETSIAICTQGASHIGTANNDNEQQSGQLLEANQLKYVNKQLHSETRGLGLCCNSLTFIGTISQSAILECVTFIEQCRPGINKSLRTIILRAPEGGFPMNKTRKLFRFIFSNSTTTKKLEQFCREHREILIKICVPRWAMGSDFMWVLSVISIVLRGDDQQLKQITSNMDEQLRSLRRAALFKRLIARRKNMNNEPNGSADEEMEDDDKICIKFPRNIRFFPEDASFDEGKFRAYCSQDAIMQRTLETDNQVLDKWICIAKEAYSHGV